MLIQSKFKSSKIVLVTSAVVLLVVIANFPAGVKHVYAQGLCEGVEVTDKEGRRVPNMEKPAYLEPYIDPVFKTKITRISDGGKGSVIKPVYSTVQAWNADESMLLLYHGGRRGGGHHLYDGQTFKHIKQINISPPDLEEVFWHTTNPEILHYVHVRRTRRDQGSLPALMRYNVVTGKRTLVRSFEEECGGRTATSGNDVQMMSWDSDVIGLRCVSREDPKAFYYRISTDTISPILPVGPGTDFTCCEAPAVAPSGKHFYANGRVLNEELEILHRLNLGKAHEHSSLGRLSNGHDALFATAFDPSPKACGRKDRGIGFLIAHDLETSQCRIVIGESNGYGYTQGGTHLSSLSYQNPGWVVMSSIGRHLEPLTNGAVAPTLFSEVYLANTDPDNPVVCRLAHHRAVAKMAKNGGYPGYFGEPHPVLSPSGTRIVFGTDWYDSGSVDTYIIELPIHNRKK